MDRELDEIENKLNLSDTDKSLMTIIMHTNTRNTNLYNVKQMKSFFNHQYKLMLNGNHRNDMDSTGIKHYQKDINQYIGKSTYNQLVSKNYQKINSANQHLHTIVDNYHHKYAIKHNLPVNTFDTVFNMRKVNQKGTLKQTKAIDNMFSNKPKTVQVASSVLNAEHGSFDDSYYDYATIVRFLNYFAMHPNTEFLPSRNSTMADPIGIPDGMTPKECQKNTIKYFKSLSHEVPMTPKQVINYCNIHLAHLNNQIKTVAKHHPRIHYRKFLTNDITALESYTHTYYGSSKYSMSNNMEFLDTSCSQWDSESQLTQATNDYHWTLKHFALLKMNYLDLRGQQIYAIDNHNYSCSFAKDVIGTYDADAMATLHQLSNSSTVHDYFEHTKHGQSLKLQYTKALIREQTLKRKQSIRAYINQKKSSIKKATHDIKRLRKASKKLNKYLK